MSLTKPLAIQALAEGKRIRHTGFTSCEWVERKDNHYVFEDGIEESSASFWRIRTDSIWDNGWSVIPKEIELTVMTNHISTTTAEEFNGHMAIHSPCGNGIIIVSKQDAMTFFNIKENTND